MENAEVEDIKISIVIVNYNVKYLLEQCLYSVRSALGGREAQIFVVDNASTDGSVEYLTPLFPEVEFIKNRENRGFGAANNQVLGRCKGQYVLLLNPDTVIGEESLFSLMFYLDDHPAIGAVGVKMLNGRGEFLPESKRSFPTLWIAFCKLFALSKLFPNSPKYAQYNLPYLNPDKPHKVDVLCGAFMLIRREALAKCGMFDESFFMYGEDIDLSYRLVHAGYKNYYMPERVLHYKGKSSEKDDLKYLESFYGAMKVFFDKYYPDSSKFLKSLVYFAIRIRMRLAALSGWKGGKRKRLNPHRRLLVISREANFATVKQQCLQMMGKLEYVNLWNLDEERALDAICRKNKMKQFTDIVFCFPDVRFEQMFLLMDTMPEKKIDYHIYNHFSKRVISPE